MSSFSEFFNFLFFLSIVVPLLNFLTTRDLSLGLPLPLLAAFEYASSKTPVS